MQDTSFMAWGSRYANRILLVVWIMASLALPAVAQQGIPSAPPADAIGALTVEAVQDLDNHYASP
jgi:hypothetical protein